MRTGGIGQTLLIKQPAKTLPEYGGEFYGAFARGGTKAHQIAPRLKKALRFQIGEQEVFALKVNHPGTKPNPYHTQTMNRLSFQIQGIVARMVNRLTEKYKGVR